MEFRWGISGWNCVPHPLKPKENHSRLKQEGGTPLRGLSGGQDVPGISHNAGEAEEGKNTVKADNTSEGEAVKTPWKKHLTLHEMKCIKYKNWLWDLPGGKMVENLPCEVGDVGSIPDQGTKIPHATGKLSPCSASTSLRSPEPGHHNLESWCATRKSFYMT